MAPLTNPFGAIILAAGASTRLGYPKQTVILQGETLLDRAVRIAQAAGARPTVVVLGSHASEVRNACRLRECTIIENELWENGMGTSIRRGIEALHDAEGTLILTCDMPTVTTAHLQALAATGMVTASRYGTKTGVPAFFPHMSFASLAQLEDSQGASRLLWGAATVPLAGGEFDVDTPGDVDALSEWKDL